MRWKCFLFSIVCEVTVLWLEGVVPAVACGALSGTEPSGVSPAVRPLGVPAMVFSGEEVLLRFACDGQTQVPWQASADRRPFASGVVVAKNDLVEIRFTAPQVKEGVTLPIRVAVEKAVCKMQVVGRPPLAGRRQWAEQLGIVLFDPSGKTAEALEKIELPCRRVTGLGALAAVTEGLVVVGEGLALEDQRGLDGVLCQLARQGVPVVLLTPESGPFALSAPGPDRFELRGADAAVAIDALAAADLKESRRFRFAGEDQGMVLLIADEASGYPWADFRYGRDRGRVCCIGWNLLPRWEASPAPRYFFVRLLEIVSGGKDLPGGKKRD